MIFKPQFADSLKASVSVPPEPAEDSAVSQKPVRPEDGWGMKRRIEPGAGGGFSLQ
jgi:hypothetical protein